MVKISIQIDVLHIDINDGCDVYVIQMLASTNQCVHEIFKILKTYTVHVATT